MTAEQAALRKAADYFRSEMSLAWGGERSWLTSGTRVADLVASILEELADEDPS